MLDFSSKHNLIFGCNGAGKTSILESLFLIAFGKSFLNSTRGEMLNRGSGEFNIISTVLKNEQSYEVGCHFSGDRLDLLIDQKRTTPSNVREIVYPVYFSSATYHLEIESLPHLRKQVNRFICGVDPIYIHYILSYNKALKQKNHLLKFRPDSDELVGWNRILSETGTRIVNCRQNFINELNREICTLGQIDLKITYFPSFSSGTDLTEEALMEEFNRIEEFERQYHRTLIGPHLDKFEINLGDRKLKSHSSGEKKIHLLMLYIAFIRLYRHVNSDFPVFLVDDFDTAMDQSNVEILMDTYPDMQILATSVNRNPRFDHQIELRKEN